MNSIPSHFIVFDGMDGSGKTTVMHNFISILEKNEVFKDKIIATREPGGTVIGKSIRELLLTSKGNGLVQQAEMLLFTADRMQTMEQIIKPALDDNKIVISDRYYWSTIAYQCFARGYNLEELLKIISLLNIIPPTLSFIFTVDTEVGLTRSKKAIDTVEEKKGEDRFEREELDFHNKVKDGYHYILEINKKFELFKNCEIIKVDTTYLSIDQTTGFVLSKYYSFLLESYGINVT